MDQDEIDRRAPGFVLGLVALLFGGFFALLGIMYDPVDNAAPVGGPLGAGPGSPGGVGDLLGEQGQSFGSPTLFVLMALGGLVLGGWASYLFRGAPGMVVASTLVALVSAYNLYGILV